MSLPPPTYESGPLQGTQLLIAPSPDTIQFQKGFLGAQGERAAIEGELQIKGAEVGQWETATISLETIESTLKQSIELYSTPLVLYTTPASSSSSSPSPSTTIPSTLPFSIPLTPDMPQCIHTPQSSISHRLVATLHPTDRAAQALTKSILVHTKRYTSPDKPLLQPNPKTFRIQDPVTVKVELPRTTFRIGEPIPVYVTIPPPDANVIVERDVRLRNIMVDLVRVVTLGVSNLTLEPKASEGTGTSDTPSSSSLAPTDEKSDALSFVRSPDETQLTNDGLHTVLTRSGSSCRFHVSRPVQIRLLLYPHQSALNNSGNDLSSCSTNQVENDNFDCASITQSTVLHSVAFYLAVNTTFQHVSTHSESIATIRVPIVLLPNPAALPEVDESIASAYRKKHDRPPVRTVRREDADVLFNEAGPSAVSPGGAPPPFEERDAPPPFFTSDPQASTSSRLPTFLESESDIAGHFSVFPIDEQTNGSHPLGREPYISIPGEGVDFGFTPRDQYDGTLSSLDRSSTPPPTMANVNLDPDVTEFANLVTQPEHALEALSLALQDHPEGNHAQPPDHSSPPPPPPPLLDDPSDPPPSIDVEEFRRPPAPPLSREHSPPHLVTLTSTPQDLSDSSLPQPGSMANAPPPYLHTQESPRQEETVTRPPPYVDVLPSRDT